MTIREILFSCFRDDGAEKNVKPAIAARSKDSEDGILRSKNEDVMVKSRELCDSSSSLTSAPQLRSKGYIKALCVIAERTYGIATDIPYPTINTPDEIIIRANAVGLNPIDWKSVEYNFCMPSFPWIGGREVAGTVEEVGTNVKDFKPGDRVWASTYYRDRRAGTFQDFCVVPQHTVLLLPAGLSFESGACLGVAALTAAMTLWKWLGVAMPVPGHASYTTVTLSAPSYILIWGGSTVTGQFAIQLARQSGLCVIAVTSGKTRLLAECLGAENVIVRDQKCNEDIVSEIRAITGDDLTMAIDIVGNETAAYCLRALSRTRPCLLAPLAFLKDGEPVPANVKIAQIEMKRFIIEGGNRVYAELLNRLVADGVVAIPKTRVLHGGLEMVEEGLRLLKHGDMNGRKLVVKI